MKWRFEHEIAVGLEALELRVISSTLLARITQYVPEIAAAWEVERSEKAHGVLERAMRFRPAVRPPLFGARLPAERLEWIERLTWNRPAHAGSFVIEPNVPAEWRRHFDGHGEYRLERRGPDRTVRVVSGIVAIDVPIVGRIAERYAVEQLARHYAGEARLLAAGSVSSG